MIQLQRFFSSAFCIALFFSLSCDFQDPGPKVFEVVSPEESGINFENPLDFDKDFNIYKYRNFYNGGGVAIGDINNDGLQDVYFTANMRPNKLFLNKGNFQFEDISESAGISGVRSWSTGVSMADINGDGLVDIYISNSGDVEGDNKQNELFINNGDLTFTESAEDYGLADRGFSTQASFFDYDKDGDLDLYLLNNSYRAIGSFNLQINERGSRDEVGGDKLYRNDGDVFTDVSAEAGIYGSVIGFGLGVTILDSNRDGWQDLYVSNDFFERDYLYINNQDGTFDEVLVESIKSISGASMGADAADINHDGYPEIFVTEMLPEPEERVKTVTTFESWDKYQFNLENGYYHQFTRNMFQLNNGEGTYSEIGRITGVEATDWSWAALMNDFDHNGETDLFVANGIYQDLTDQDYIQYVSSNEIIQTITGGDEVDFQQLIDLIPSRPIPNYMFSGQGDLEFSNVAESWGLGEPSFSNGSAYGDLDNDGDLDLVVNNVNMPAFVYRNTTAEKGLGNWLMVSLEGEGGNTQAIGAQLSVWAAGKLYWREQVLHRGFQSTIDARLHVGLGEAVIIDSLRLSWPDGSITKMDNIPVNQMIILSQMDAMETEYEQKVVESEPMLIRSEASVNFIHSENAFVDFDRDRLLFHMRSTEGPAGCTSSDQNLLYTGGAKDQSGKLFQKYRSGWEEVFTTEALHEDTDCVFFDADGDGDEDLYVTSGGNEFSSSSDGLFDRLYTNNGETWNLSQGINAAVGFHSNGTVSAADWDGDGDIDLFVGERLRPFAVGMPVSGRLLQNNGNGIFTDATESIAPTLSNSGMFTGSEFADIDSDGDLDLITSGEWAPIRIFSNQLIETGQATFSETTNKAGLGNSNGWWNEVLVLDWDGDGLLDVIGLNHGLNSRFRASYQEPANLWVSDFDGNGSVEQILTTYNEQESYPMVLRHNLVNQLPGLKRKYLKYEAYKEQTINDIFTEEELSKATELTAYTLASTVWWGNEDGSFIPQELPIEAQLSPMYAGAFFEIDGEGSPELILGGNLYGVKPEAGRYDASFGAVLKIEPGRSIRSISSVESGLKVDGQIRQVLPLSDNELLILRNDDSVLKYFIKN